jgi:uncharacterized protein (DUF2267 family)
MNARTATAADRALVATVRDRMAADFARAVAADLPGVLETLQSQLAATPDGERLRTLRAATDLVRAMAGQLADRIERHARQRFDAKLNPGNDPLAQTVRFSAASLAVVADNEVQEEIAIGNSARHLRGAVADGLSDLTQRIGFLLGMRDLPDARNPAFPRVFARALLDALSEATDEVPVRLAAFASFSPAMLNALPAVYQTANTMLRERGVLPVLARDSLTPSQSIATPWSAITPASPVPQSRAALLARLLAASGSALPDLVAAIFARLRADARIAGSARGAISRLEQSFLEIAGKDPRILTEGSHPVRGLLDTMAELGLADEGPQIDGRPGKEWLAAQALAIGEAHLADAQAFAAVRDRLAAVAVRQREARVGGDPVISGLEEEEVRLAAQQEASLQIAHRIGAAHCPEAAAAFVYRAWQPVLAHDLRTVGRSDPLWQADLDTLGDLLWTFTPRIAASERMRLTTLLPALRYRVKQALMRSGLAREEADALMDQMGQIHAELERAPAAAALGELRIASTGAPGVQGQTKAGTTPVTSATLEAEGFARGAWIELTEVDGSRRRCRIEWAGPLQGACALRELSGKGASFAMAIGELQARRGRGLAVPMDGPGIAADAIEGAILDEARKRGLAAAGADS